MKNKQDDLIRSDFDLRKCFEGLRFDPKHHLGFGDIRLTIAQQDGICDLVEHFHDKISEKVKALDDHRIKIEEMELTERNRANAAQKEIIRLKKELEKYEQPDKTKHATFR